jgi:hypothetical protein
MSAIENLEKRLLAVETDLAQLKKKSGGKEVDDRPWFEKIYGTFANDPLYDEAMRLGREYRESTRPKKNPKKKKAR